MIVIGILGLILAIGIPNYLAHERRRNLEAARDEVGALVGYARQAAVERGGTVLTLSGTPTRFTVTQSSGTVLKSYTAPTAVTVTPPAGQTTFTFAANGSVSAGGNFVFSVGDASDIVLTLDAMTGAATAK